MSKYVKIYSELKTNVFPSPASRLLGVLASASESCTLGGGGVLGFALFWCTARLRGVPPPMGVFLGGAAVGTIPSCTVYAKVSLLCYHISIYLYHVINI